MALPSPAGGECFEYECGISYPDFVFFLGCFLGFLFFKLFLTAEFPFLHLCDVPTAFQIYFTLDTIHYIPII